MQHMDSGWREGGQCLRIASVRTGSEQTISPEKLNVVKVGWVAKLERRE
jgi:hypothetical protein